MAFSWLINEEIWDSKVNLKVGLSEPVSAQTCSNNPIFSVLFQCVFFFR